MMMGRGLGMGGRAVLRPARFHVPRAGLSRGMGIMESIRDKLEARKLDTEMKGQKQHFDVMSSEMLADNEFTLDHFRRVLKVGLRLSCACSSYANM